MFCRNINKLHIAAPFVAHDFILRQFLADALGVRRFLVNFVHGHHQRHTGGFGVGNRFHRLRHHAVIGGHHQNHDVGGLRAACTHSGKRFVPRSIQERHHAARCFDVIRADVLRDAARFACHHFAAADVVQQRSFTVVNVPHHRNNGWARQQFCRAGGFFAQEGIGVVDGGGFSDVSHFFHHNQRGFLVQRLVDGNHHAHFHQRFDHFHAFHRHFVRQIGNGDGFGHQHFMHHGLGGGLEAVLVGFQFQFFAFFAAAHALVVAAASAASVFAAFAFAFAATHFFIIAAVAAVVFFAAAAAGVFRLSWLLCGRSGFQAARGVAQLAACFLFRFLAFGFFGFFL